MSSRLFQAVKLGFGGISANRMRAFLTMLGVIIGVAAVISVVSTGRGAARKISRQIEDMGSNLITVELKGRPEGVTLPLDECLELEKREGVEVAAPVIPGWVDVKYGDVKHSTGLEGVTPGYEAARNYKIAEGRFITRSDVDYGQQVALVGAEAANRLFASRNPVGEDVKINGHEFKVIGLLQKKGGTAYDYRDDSILIPVTAVRKVTGNRTISTLLIKAENPADVGRLTMELKSYFMAKFRDRGAFTVSNQQDVLTTLNTVAGILTLLLSAIAGISLLVGGIGIMNIMLVSITERTKEIGIRKALGAKRRDILFQFLVEAMAISGMGGMAGVALGLFMSYMIGKTMDISAAVPLNAIITAFIFSLAVGVVFGIYPAYRASGLNPIDALKFE